MVIKQTLKVGGLEAGTGSPDEDWGAARLTRSAPLYSNIYLNLLDQLVA